MTRPPSHRPPPRLPARPHPVLRTLPSLVAGLGLALAFWLACRAWDALTRH